MASLPPTFDLDGIYAAAITPRGKHGDVDFGAVFEIVDYLCAARLDGIALFTEWGEYPALGVEERARVTKLAVKRSRVPILAGVGSARLDHSLALAREARNAGVAAILLPPPLPYRYDADDLAEFYAQFAAQFGTGVPIVTNVENRLVTDDRQFVAARREKRGALSGAACAAPELTVALDTAICTGDEAVIARLQGLWQELLAWLDRFPMPAGVKTAVAARGIATGPLPVPLSPAKQRCLDQFREWFKAWLPATRKLASHA